MQPSNADIMSTLHEIHGDVKVALDRTVTHTSAINALSTRVDEQGISIAHAKGQATILGAISAAIVAGLIAVGKTILGVPHSS